MQTESLKTVLKKEPTKLNLYFSKSCEAKIRTACKVFNNVEWSGAAFYRYMDHKDSTVDHTSLMVVDFVLQDVGCLSYTEYSLDGETAGYYAEHIDELGDCKVGLLHSHNVMEAFFSSTDAATFKQQAEQCNNVLSIVVNNAGNYVAMFAERHILHKDEIIITHTKEKDTWKYMGDKSKEENRNYVTHKGNEYTEALIKYWECEIHKDDNCEINEEFEKECVAKYNELKNKRLKQPDMYDSFVKREDVYLTKKYKEHLKSIHKDYTKEINSILQLSFNPDTSSEVVLSNEFSEAFIYCFMQAWCEFYKPSIYDITIIRDIFTEKTKNYNYNTTRNYIINLFSDFLIDFYNEY